MNSKQKNDILRTLAELLMKNKKPIIQANQQDLALCSLADKVVYDRLIIDDKKIEDMVASIEKIIALADPEGKILFSHKHENGLKIENRSVPFGTVLIIYESRPDVTIEATAIALKAGNKVILKGGKEAKNTNVYLVDLWNEALALNAQSVEWISYLDISRAETQILIQDNSKKIDLIIPRGGQALIDFVKKYSLVPVLVGGRGNNFLYIDEETDFVMAEKIIINGKQVLSACNSLDKVLINSKISGLDEKLKELVEELKNNSISLIGDDELCRLDSEIRSI